MKYMKNSMACQMIDKAAVGERGENAWLWCGGSFDECTVSRHRLHFLKIYHDPLLANLNFPITDHIYVFQTLSSSYLLISESRTKDMP